MLFEYISVFLGYIKITLYKLLYFSRIRFKGIPIMNSSFRITTKKNAKINIGKRFRTRNNVSLRIYEKGELNIGNDVFLNDACSINCQGKIDIGNNVMFGQNVMIFDHDHDYKNNIKKFVKKNVQIGNNVWIGANCIILKGVTIGDNCVIGANTLINKDVVEDTMLLQKKEDIYKKLR